ncbi:AsmA-like C-terminal region-containing protein [Yoonia sp. SS1-5]|uniref:AsmA-like C-terminal region-containing protein n=1 Tax=Yoonia rhodophyticola TaxID=3137370 RepID=A0AAN0M7Z2_9RHOB
MTETPETESKNDPPAVKVRSRRGMPRWRFALHICTWVIFAPILFAAAMAVMMVDRDITAPSWIVARIEARAADLLGGGTLDFGQITLRIGADLHPRVRLIDSRLTDANGALISRIPLAEGLMSPRGLILNREVLMQDIHLTGAQINLRRAADGSVAVAFGAAEVGQARSLPELLDQVDLFFERPQLAALEQVRADGLVVNFDDARADRTWLVDGGNLSLDLRDGQTALSGDFALLSGRDVPTNVSLSYLSPRGARSARIGLNITDAVASDIATQSPALSWLRDIEAPMTAALRTTLDDDGKLGPLNATLEIGAGALRPNATTEPVQFTSAKAYLSYDPNRDRMALSQIAVETEWGSLRADGEAYLREIRDGLPRALLTQFRFRDVILRPGALYDAPLHLPQAEVDLRVRFDPFSVEIGQAVIVDGQTRLQARGDIAVASAGWDIALDAQVDQIAPEAVLEYWPTGIKPGTRRWVSQNVTGGALHDAAFALRIAPGVKTRFAVGFGFEGSQIKFMRDIPPVQDAVGTVSIIDQRFAADLYAGKLSAPLGGQIDMAGTSFVIPDLGIRNPPAVLDLNAASSITGALAVLNLRPFLFMDKANLPVVLADGRMALTGDVAFPLKPRMTSDEVTFAMRAELTRVRSDVLIPDRVLAAPKLTVDVDRQGIVIAGPARLGRAQMDGRWTQTFGAAAGGRSNLSADVVLSQDFLDEFGIALPPGSVTGRSTGALQVDLQPGRPTRFGLRSNLRGLGVTIPPLGWSKPPGTQAALTVQGTLGPIPQISQLSISGAGLQAEGRITLDGNKRLEAAQFSRVRVGDWLDAPITLRGRGAGAPVGVEISGGALDLRRARFGAGGRGGGPVRIALDRLQITEGIALTGFAGNFTTAGGFTGQFDAAINGQAAIQGTVAPRNGRSAVRLRSNDAGGVARAAGFMRNGVGGTLDLTLLPSGGEGTFDGALIVQGLRVRDAPAMAALLDAISVVGLLQQLDGQGLAFDEVDARFRLTPAQVIITQASAVGPGLGISIDGLYTLASKQLDLQGVVSPFYLVNSIGSFLTRRGEGLIGFNFNITGTANAPQVSVNPLSAFTPGMFREIFRRPPPQVTR